MVAKYTPPDNTTQNGAAYKSNLDGAVVAGARIDQAFLPQAQDTPNMTVRVLAGALLNGTTLTEVAAQNTGTIGAPVTHPRIDRVVLNPATGAIQVVTGTEAASPVAPAIPADRLPLCRFQLATGTTAISNALIVDERVGAGGGALGDGAVTARKESDDPWSSVASAATVDLGAINSRNALITGTTTITSLGNTGAEGRTIRVRFAAALTLTHNATTLILPGGANITTAAGDTAIFVKEAGASAWRCVDYLRANGQAVVASAQVIVDRAYAEYTSSTDLTAVLPNDDTIPQNTEGTQILSVTITPKTTTNRLRVSFQGQGSGTVHGNGAGSAIFRDSGANAIDARSITATGVSYAFQMNQVIEVVAGSVAATTFNVRVGPSAGTLRMNGFAASARVMGGVSRATLLVEEIAA
jgi:hypothetical protein